MPDSRNEKDSDPLIQNSQSSPPLTEKLTADTGSEKNAIAQLPNNATTPDPRSGCESFEFSIPARNLPAKFPMVFVLLVLAVAISVHGLAIQFWHLISGSLFGDFLISILFGMIFLSISYYFWVNRLHRHNLILRRLLIAALVLRGAMCIIGICHSISKLGHHGGATVSTDQAQSETTDKGLHTTAAHPEFNPLETVLMLLLGVFSLYFLFDAEHSRKSCLRSMSEAQELRSHGNDRSNHFRRCWYYRTWSIMFHLPVTRLIVAMLGRFSLSNLDADASRLRHWECCGQFACLKLTNPVAVPSWL